MEIIYNNTKLSKDICKLINKYYVLKPKLYLKELLNKTNHIFQISINKFYNMNDFCIRNTNIRIIGYANNDNPKWLICYK